MRSSGVMYHQRGTERASNWKAHRFSDVYSNLISCCLVDVIVPFSSDDDDDGRLVSFLSPLFVLSLFSRQPDWMTIMRGLAVDCEGMEWKMEFVPRSLRESIGETCYVISLSFHYFIERDHLLVYNKWSRHGYDKWQTTRHDQRINSSKTGIENEEELRTSL